MKTDSNISSFFKLSTNSSNKSISIAFNLASSLRQEEVDFLLKKCRNTNKIGNYYRLHKRNF
ncbi:MAG: hypothetical protein SOV59_12725 [Fusobacterium mortiferum]|nr:hypothetical protein [Fusobacterium mortiferum]